MNEVSMMQEIPEPVTGKGVRGQVQGRRMLVEEYFNKEN